MKLKHIIILQNKIDLVKESQARDQCEQIRRFIQGTIAEDAPIIPISAQLKYNIDTVCEYVTKKIPIPPRDFTSEPRLIGNCYKLIKIPAVSFDLRYCNKEIYYWCGLVLFGLCKEVDSRKKVGGCYCKKS